MNIIITGRHFDVTEPIKAYAEEKISRLDKFFTKILDAHAILAVEKFRHIAEITLFGKELKITATKTTQDMYASIDKAVESLDNQLRKFHERIKEHKIKKAHKVKDKAMRAVSVGAQTAYVAPLTGAVPKIVEMKRLAEKPMSVEEATDELSISSGEFLVFRNSEDDKINVIYRRKDGNLGLIKS